jgi:hypothetical protein
MDMRAVGGVFDRLRAHNHDGEIFTSLENVAIGESHHGRHFAKTLKALIIPQLVQKIFAIFQIRHDNAPRFVI